MASALWRLSQNRSRVTCNYMRPKSKKCKVMHISFLCNGPYPPVIILNNEPLESVSSLPLLGITIQFNLKQDSQVQQVIERVFRRLYVLCKLERNGVATADLVFIYTTYSTSTPFLEFGAPMWSPSLSMQQLASIERVQQRAVHIIAFPERHQDIVLLLDYTTTSFSVRRTDILTNIPKLLLSPSQCNLLLPRRQ